MIGQISDALDWVVGWVITFLLAALVVVVFAAVVARYGLNSSLVWSDEVARGLLAWMVFLGAATAYKNMDLVDIGLIRDNLPAAIERAFRIFGTVLVLIFLGYTIYYGLELMQRNTRQVSAVLRIKQNYFSAAVLAGSIVMLLHGVSHLVDLLSGKVVAHKDPVDEAFAMEAEHGFAEAK